MEYISTRNTENTFSFKDVFLKGLAPDGGLFVPKEIPIFSEEERLFASKNLQECIKSTPLDNLDKEIIPPVIDVIIGGGAFNAMS